MGIAILGDIMLGRHMTSILEENSVADLLNPIRPLIQQHHIIANLESPLASGDRLKDDGSPVLWAPLAFAEQLDEAGIAAVSLANNHIFDAGKEGLYETIAALENNGVGHVGAGENRAHASQPHILQVDGYKVGLLAFSYTPPATEDKPGVAYIYDDTMEQAIEATLPLVDFLIAMPHCGIELYQYPLPRDQFCYKKMIDLGVGLVVGKHSHCVQAMELYQGRSIFYSLGDCIFDHHHPDVWAGNWRGNAHAKQFALSATKELPRISLAVIVEIKLDAMQIHYEPVKMGTSSGPTMMSEVERNSWLESFEALEHDLLHNPVTQQQRNDIEEQLSATLRKNGTRYLLDSGNPKM